MGLSAMTPAQVYQLVADFLRRVQPDTPAYPGSRFNPRRQPFPSDPGEAILTVSGEGGPPPPNDGPPDAPSNPNDPQWPDDPPDFPSGPGDPNPPHWPDDPGGPDFPNAPGDPNHPHGYSWVVVQMAQFGGASGEAEDEPMLVTRQPQTSYTDPFDQAAIGPWWTVAKGTWAIVGGLLTVTAVSTDTPPAAIFYNPVDFTVGQINATIDTIASGIKYVLARFDPATGNGYAFAVNAGGGVASCFLYKITNWAVVFTLIALPATTFIAGDTMGIRCTGTTIQCLKNGALVTGGQTTDATYASGKLGLGASTTVPAWRDAVVVNA